MSQKQNSSQNWNISFTILNIDLMKKWKVGLIYELFTLNPLVDELHTIVLNNIIICKKKRFGSEVKSIFMENPNYFVHT